MRMQARNKPRNRPTRHNYEDRLLAKVVGGMHKALNFYGGAFSSNL